MEKSVDQSAWVRVHLTLTPEENEKLDILQREYRDSLQLTFVSKAATIRNLIRNASTQPNIS
jgi:hypothetical protein